MISTQICYDLSLLISFKFFLFLSSFPFLPFLCCFPPCLFSRPPISFLLSPLLSLSASLLPTLSFLRFCDFFESTCLSLPPVFPAGVLADTPQTIDDHCLWQPFLGSRLKCQQDLSIEGPHACGASCPGMSGRPRHTVPASRECRLYPSGGNLTHLLQLFHFLPSRFLPFPGFLQCLASSPQP